MWGRENETRDLKALMETKRPSLVVISGRRRIGKSTLAQNFGKTNFKHFFEFSGLAPHPKQSNQDQLNHFANQLSEQSDIKGLHFQDWDEAFNTLNKLANKKNQPVFILIDEISWMGGLDPDFPGKFKVAWDTKFKQNSKVFITLCGSVTSWIQENILNRADFVGRISMEINLQELPLSSLTNFWGRNKERVSATEKLTVLCVTGGVPRYLEEFRYNISADIEIARLCFQQSGFFFNEFEKIFNEIYQKKATTYLQIIRLLVDKKLAAVEIAKKLKKEQNSEFSKSLFALEIGGYIARDSGHLPNGKKTKTTYYRIKDNYLRFYIKYIEPAKDKILQAGFKLRSINDLPNWNAIAGYQFENLILNHRSEIIKHLNIGHESILSAAPYYQRKKTRNRGSCQIDLLISCKYNTIYICEIKFRKIISKTIIKEVEDKISVIEKTRAYSIRPILIYAGQLDPNGEDEIRAYFDQILSIDEILVNHQKSTS